MVDTIHRRKAAPYTTGRVKARRRRAVTDRIALLLALCGALILLLSQLTMLPMLTIQSIEVSGTAVVGEDDVRNIVEREIAGVYVGLFSKSNILLYPRRHIERTILSELSRVKDVDVSMRSLTSLSVALDERESLGVWCGDDATSPEPCYFVDEGGLIYARAPEFSERLFFEFYSTVKGVNPLGERIVEEAEFRSLYAFTLRLESLSLDARGLSIADDHAEVILENGARILFDTKDGYDAVYENLSLVLSSNEFRADAGEGRLLLIDYIDLRFGNKVFYKFSEE